MALRQRKNKQKNQRAQAAAWPERAPGAMLKSIYTTRE
jgi:hypothetical protein